MNEVFKFAIYVCLATLSWRSGFQQRPNLIEVQDITTCAAINPIEKAAHTQTFTAHFVYYCYELFTKPRNKMFLVHHVTTCMLVLMGIALGTGGIRVGSTVMFLHGATDIALQLTRWVSMRVPKLIAFMGLIVSWAVLRLWYFGHVVDVVYRAIEQEYADCGGGYGVMTGWVIVVALLSLLFCMNCYWFVLIGSKGCKGVKKVFCHA
jgi:hypothetical protein